MTSTKPPTISCQICNKIFFKSCLNNHMRIHTGERPYQCPLCPKTFTQKPHLDSHQEAIHSNKKKYKCDMCTKRFSTKDSQKLHMARHAIQGRPFKCGICGATFKENSKMREHLRIQHDPNYSRGFKCIFCNKILSTKLGLDEHLLSHTQERPYFCKLCPAELQTQHNLNRHMKNHDPNRPKDFKCDICQKQFVDRRTLDKHMYSHVIARHYECDKCGKTVGSIQALGGHRRVHSGSFPCRKCRVTCKSREGLKLHGIEAHPKPKLHACPLCSKLFFTESSMCKHIPTHTNEEPYKCEICKRSWKAESTLKRHNLKFHFITSKKC